MRLVRRAILFFGLAALMWCMGTLNTKGEAMIDLAGKKVLLVIARNNFRDEELAKPSELLKKSGAQVVVAASSLEPSRGMLGALVKPDVLLKDCQAADYDGVVFIGGAGAKEYFDDAGARALAQQAKESGKVLGAICIAPVILANAGVLKGRHAVVFPGMENALLKGGAKLGSGAVAADGRVVTASGPDAAESFGHALAQALAGK